MRNLNDLARKARTDPEVGFPANLDSLLSGPYAAVVADLVASRLDIGAKAGEKPRWLAWPYGFATDALDSLGHVEVGDRDRHGVLDAADQDAPGDFESETEGYTRWDAGAEYRLVTGGAELLLFLQFRNLGDEPRFK